MKIAWICNFANNEFNQLFNKNDINEIAPWINQLIKLFENDKDIDIYVISPNLYTNKEHIERINGINYHFYKYRPSILPALLYYRLGIGYFLNLNKRTIGRIIQQIMPDVIHLHGTENPYYSSTIFQFRKKYPVLVTIQGFISNSSPKKGLAGFIRKKRILCEIEILHQFKHFGIRADFMQKKILCYNSNACFYWHNYPIKIPDITQLMVNPSKEFDCVFFAKVCKDKGIEDLLNSISIIKKNGRTITLLIIGPVSKKYKSQILRMANRMNIANNITFAGFIKTQDDVFSELLKASISVLPTLHDIIPGTIIEAMFLKVPVLAYNVGGLPDLIKNRHCIELVERGDIKSLADKIIYLLDHNEIRNDMAENAFYVAHEKFRNFEIKPALINAYRSIVTKKV